MTAVKFTRNAEGENIRCAYVVRMLPMGVFRSSLRSTPVVAVLSISPALHAEVCELTAAEVFRRGGPSTVQIVALTVNPFTRVERANWSQGSGIVINDRGLVLTNSHVVHGSHDVAVWVGSEEERREASVVGDDPITDLALLQVEGNLRGATPAIFRESALEIGETVFAVGNALGLGKTISHGVVSGLERQVSRNPLRRYLKLVQTDAAINPGNSGGPLFDSCARVVGINTVKANADNVGFAVPATTVLPVTVRLREHGRVPRAWHGVNGQLVDPLLALLFRGLPIRAGFLVETIEPGSPAEEIGLKPGRLPVNIGLREFLLGGDLLIAVNGIELVSEAAIDRVIESLVIGEAAHIRYWRDGREHETEVVLPERPVLPQDIVHPIRKR